MIRNHGENYVDSHPELPINNTIGGNYRLSELHAAIAMEQLKKLDAIVENRNKLAKHLIIGLSGIDGIKTHVIRENSTHAWYFFPIQYDEDKVGISRSIFVEAVNAEFPKPNTIEDVALTQGYVQPLYKSRVYQESIAIGTKGFPFNVNKPISYDYSGILCPITEKMYNSTLLLTSLVRDPLTVEDIDDLVDAIIKVINNKNSICNNLSGKHYNKMASTVEIASKT